MPVAKRKREGSQLQLDFDQPARDPVSTVAANFVALQTTDKPHANVCDISERVFVARAAARRDRAQGVLRSVGLLRA